MTDQLKLFDSPAPRPRPAPDQSGSATSRADAEHIRPATPLGQPQTLILEALKNSGPVRENGQYGGLTIPQLTHQVAWLSGEKADQAAIRSRLAALRKDGLVEDSGHTRPAETGTQCVIWRLS